MNRREIWAEPPHETEATAGPTGVVSGRLRVHCARLAAAVMGPAAVVTVIEAGLP